MKRMNEEEILLTPKQIKEIVTRLADEINRYYANLPKGESVLIVGVLRGAFVFLADLVRELTIPVQIDFIRIASYGTATKSSGTIQLIMEPGVPLTGRRVLIVEDIIDTGRSMAFLHSYFRRQQIGDLATAVLLDKPSRREIEVPCNFIGQTVEDRFLAGYGLDGGDMFQNIPWIFTKDP